MINVLLIVLFFLAFLLEATVTTLPLVLLALLCLAVARRKSWVFSLAFISGILLDILLVRTVGITSLLFLIFLFIILLYERKYEIRTLPFVVISSFVGTLLYGMVFSLPFLFLQAVLSSIVTSIVFVLFSFNYVKVQKGFRSV